MPEASVIPIERLAPVAARHPKLSLLLLFGSRARGDARDDSDWDVGYLAEPGIDPDALLLDLVDALGTDRVDLVDLARAGAQIAFRAAAEGRVVYEAKPGRFGEFWFDAVDFWCDVEPILRSGYADVLARLRRGAPSTGTSSPSAPWSCAGTWRASPTACRRAQPTFGRRAMHRTRPSCSSIAWVYGAVATLRPPTAATPLAAPNARIPVGDLLP